MEVSVPSMSVRNHTGRRGIIFLTRISNHDGSGNYAASQTTAPPPPARKQTFGLQTKHLRHCKGWNSSAKLIFQKNGQLSCLPAKGYGFVGFVHPFACIFSLTVEPSKLDLNLYCP